MRHNWNTLAFRKPCEEKSRLRLRWWPPLLGRASLSAGRCSCLQGTQTTCSDTDHCSVPLQHYLTLNNAYSEKIPVLGAIAVVGRSFLLHSFATPH